MRGARPGAPDHFPTCPSCGELCGKLAQVCAECGTLLVLDADVNSQLRSRGMRQRMKAANEREDRETAREKAE